MQEIVGRPECSWIGGNLEAKAVEYAVSRLVPTHLEEVRSRKLELLSKTEAAVKERLTKEIASWDYRAADLQSQEQAGKPNARLNSSESRRRADDLQGRLQKRMDAIQRERQLSPLPPSGILGGVCSWCRPDSFGRWLVQSAKVLRHATHRRRRLVPELR